MRLIDADEFKEFILTYGKAGYRALTIEKISELIDGQSTAYDVDKVIKRSEETATEELGINKTRFDMDRGEYSSYCSLCLSDVIDIIKSGGVAND